MFKVNNKDTRVTPVSTVNFKHVIVGWVSNCESRSVNDCERNN